MHIVCKYFIIFAIIYWSNTISLAQISDDTTILMKNQPIAETVQWYSLFKNIPQQWQGWWDISFTKDRTNEWVIIGGLTLATVLTDDITYTPSARFYHSSPEAKRWSDFFAGFGDGRTQFALAGGFTAYGLAFNDQKALRTGVQIASVGTFFGSSYSSVEARDWTRKSFCAYNANRYLENFT